MKKASIFTINILILTFVLSSCSKKWDTPAQIDESNQTPKTETVSTLDNIQVPANFNWETVKDVEVKISGSSEGLVEASSVQGTIYQKAYLAQGQTYTMKLSVPTYESSLKLKLNDQSGSVDISSGTASYSFN